MYKKLFSVFTAFTMLSFSAPSFASEKTLDSEFKISQNVFEYPNSTTPLMQEYNKELTSQLVDPGKAMGLSALYFGLGQIYSGEKEKGAWLMAGGSALTVGILAIVVPRISARPTNGFQDNAKFNATAISLIALGGFYLWNVRDAYETAVQKNTNIRKQLLFGANFQEFEKISFSNIDNGLALNYNISNF